MVPEASALLVVDVQNDFMPGGALPVHEGGVVIPRLNRYIELSLSRGLLVLASRDWHPAETRHFERWPVHCVQGTWGAAFAPGLELPPEAVIISKGMDPAEDAYSAFQGVDQEGMSLAQVLEAHKVRRLYVGGLALDYCVKASLLDARAAGLEAVLLIDATRAVNVHIHDAEEAIEELVRAGVLLATIERLTD